MIRVRNDDVLVPSRGWTHPDRRFREVHELIAGANILHIPTVVVTDGGLEDYPDIIRYMRAETEAGRMTPEIHGWRHIDYAKLSEAEVREEIRSAQSWIADSFGRLPQMWMTPWGASAPHLHRAAESLSLILVDTSRIVELSTACRRLRTGKATVESLNDVEIFMHWWSRGARLNRLCAAVSAGSWEAAQNMNPKLYK